MPKDGVERRLVAILAADVVGYSQMMEADEEGTLALLDRCRDVLNVLSATIAAASLAVPAIAYWLGLPAPKKQSGVRWQCKRSCRSNQAQQTSHDFASDINARPCRPKRNGAEKIHAFV